MGRTSWPPRCGGGGGATRGAPGGGGAAGDYARAERELSASRDLLGRLGALEGVELWTSAATHAVLPLVATDAGLRLQLATGIESHERRFGSFGGGFWLPECAYEPGLERELADQGVRAFCVDQTAALGHGALDQLEPVATAAGPVAVPIDGGMVELVWNDKNGYPVHADYRNYWGRTVHDLKPWDNGGRPPPRAAALELAREHARDSVGRAIERVDALAGDRGRPALLTCALDP